MIPCLEVGIIPARRDSGNDKDGSAGLKAAMEVPVPASCRLRRTSAAALAVLSLVVAFRPLSDIDVHWHLARGRDILERGGFPERDPFSWNVPDRPPDRQAWLADVLFHTLRSMGGLPALRIFCALLVAAAVTRCHALLLRLGASPAPAFSGAFVVLALFRDRIQHRPDLFSFLFAILVIESLVRPRIRPRAAAALLTALWANLHPGAVLAPLIAAAMVPPLRGPGLGLRLATVPLLGAATLLNPDATGIWLYLAETAPLSHLIPEWQSLFRLGLPRFWPEAAALAVIAALFARTAAARGGQRPPAPLLSLGLLGIALAVSAVRFTHMLFLPLAAALTASHGDRGRRRAATIALAILAPLAAGLLADDAVRRIRAARLSGLPVLADVHTPQYPVRIADLLLRAGLEGRLWNPPAFGGYLIDRLHPRLRVAIDGRVTLYGPARAADALDILRSPHREIRLLGLDVEIVLLPPGTAWSPDRFVRAAEVPGEASLWLRRDTPAGVRNRERLRRALLP